MKLSIKNSIYQAIIENKWLNISYKNSSGETTYFRIGIDDIIIQNGVYKIKVSMFNETKSFDCKPSFLKIDSILSASIVDNSYYPSSEEILKKVSENTEYFNFLEAQNLDNNILCYLSDCYKLDNDPYVKDTVVVPDVDTGILSKHSYELDDEQFKLIIDKVFKKNVSDSEKMYRYCEFAINVFSLDIDNRQYVIAYKPLELNFKTKVLRVADESLINKSFLIDDKRISLSSYLDMNADDFVASFNSNEEEYIEHIKGRLNRGEIPNTRPTLFILSRNTNSGVDEAFESINTMEKENKLTLPIKSFFGRNRPDKNIKKEPNIVVFDKNKINIDQLRVVYNSMVHHVTFVKGPPGTGKTETIFNVILSAYANDKTVLICSNNNHPMNDIYKKMISSFKHKKSIHGQAEPYPFPILRLGNKDELGKTLEKLKEILEFAQDIRERKIEENKTLKTKNECLSEYSQLRKLLEKYEQDKELYDDIQRLKTISKMITSKHILKEIEEKIRSQEDKLHSTPKLKNSDVVNYTISANEDKSFQDYLYYSSMLRLKKLFMPSNAELVSIISSSNIENSVAKFETYLKDEKNLKNFLGIFPIIISTNISCHKLGDPIPKFDLCIMDEAGQCNISSSLIPIIRANDLLLVGDTNQLQPVTVLETNINEKLINKYGIKKEYNYIRNSILSTMLAKDENSKSILLRYHYRCGHKIANFVNDRFYNKQLNLRNTAPGELIYGDVKNTIRLPERNTSIEEAKVIVKLIKENNYKDVGILTPFVNQAALINFELKKAGIDDVKAGTIHTLQGSEKNTIIFSAALSLRTGQKTMDWIKNNSELINVAVTRAKDRFYFIGDKQAIDLKNGDENTDIKTLSDYVYENGKYEVTPSEKILISDFSNNSSSEKMFFETLEPYFERKHSFRLLRNIKVSEAIKGITKEDLKKAGAKEFDLILQKKRGLEQYKTIIVFEVDGGEHVGSKETASRDRIKEQICKDYGIKTIRISNSEIKDYTLIIQSFEKIIKQDEDFDLFNFELHFND